jgi:hypothetical protein
MFFLFAFLIHLSEMRAASISSLTHRRDCVQCNSHRFACSYRTVGDQSIVGQEDDNRSYFGGGLASNRRLVDETGPTTL